MAEPKPTKSLLISKEDKSLHPVLRSRETRFWGLVNKQGTVMPHMTTPCWEWQGCRKTRGYGEIKIQNRRYTTHRLVWFYTYGAFPRPCALHHCDNTACVNPEHLYEVNCDGCNFALGHFMHPSHVVDKWNARIATAEVTPYREALRALGDAVDHISTNCVTLDHTEGMYHAGDVECPVTAKIQAAVAHAKELLEGA